MFGINAFRIAEGVLQKHFKLHFAIASARLVASKYCLQLVYSASKVLYVVLGFLDLAETFSDIASKITYVFP